MRKIHVYIAAAFLTISAGCDKLLDAGGPADKVQKDLIFGDDMLATAAVRGIYKNMTSYGYFSSGLRNSVPVLAGLSSDEQICVTQDITYLQFGDNEILVNNSEIENLWSSLYATLYHANDVMESLEASSQITAATKQQLRGEVLFVRAFCHFYLVNLFGDVPVITTADYRQNMKVVRQPAEDAWLQILKDLPEAVSLLSEAYPTTERVRPNRAVAEAFLARVQLYRKNWADAEDFATRVINRDIYRLTALDSITVSNNTEAVWQIHPGFEGFNIPYEGNTASDPLQGAALRDDFPEVFENGDMRKDAWIKVRSNKNTCFKYQNILNESRREYSVVIRLAEVLLIRAEARAQQGNIDGAIEDIDAVRSRAGLPLFRDTRPDISQPDMLMAIEHERVTELFAEWGHRWLDLKRTGRVDAVVGALKTTWDQEDALYPVPQIEFRNNPFLGDQNPGY